MPEITETSLGYRIAYDNLKLTITISRIHLHKDGRMTAEFLIETTAPGYSPLLHQSQINLLSTRSRQSLCKELETRYEAPWPEILEQACAAILDRVRKGEPVQFISTFDDNIEPPQYLIEPLLPLRQPTAIFGLPGTMKSYMAILCSIITSLPWHDNPFGLKASTESHLALYLDYESSKELMTWRLKKLQRGLELPDLIIPYRRCALPLAEDINTIKKLIEETKAKFLIIDSIGGACGGDLYAPEPVLQFFAALRTLNLTTLILAHTSKENAKEKSILGSVYWTAYSRQIFQSLVSHEANENEISIGLFHRKSNEDKLFPPIGFHFFFDESLIRVEREDVKGVAGLLEHLALSQKVLEILKEGSMTLAEIADSLETRKDTIAITLSRLKNKGQVTKLGEKKWGLSASLSKLPLSNFNHPA